MNTVPNASSVRSCIVKQPTECACAGNGAFSIKQVNTMVTLIKSKSKVNLLRSLSVPRNLHVYMHKDHSETNQI